jgi:hypothetical protein
LSHTKESKNKQHNPNRNANHRSPSQAPKGDNLRVQETGRCTDEKEKSDCPSCELRQRDLEAESNKPRRIEWLQLFANVLMLMITALAVVVYYQQLSTTQTDERAWLRVDLVNQTKEPDSAVVVDQSQPLSAYISVTNTGKTAAKSIYVDACVEILDNTSPAQAAWMSSCYSRPHYRVETGMLFPETSIGNAQMQKVNRKTVPDPPTSDQSKQFTAGKNYVVVFGRAHYIDIFGKRHWTQFCFPATHASFLSEAARQCVNFVSEGQGDFDSDNAKAQ